MKFKKLPFDPELNKFLVQLPENGLLDFNTQPGIEDVLPPTLSHQEFRFQGPDSNELTISVFRRKDFGNSPSKKRPGIYYIHGGGMVTGNRFLFVDWALKVVEKFDAVCVTIEYRLAPSHPDPAPVEDCYAGISWMHAHAPELGIDPEKIIVNGISAGGGLAAGVTLLCRDRGGPKLAGQLLFAPMLDDRSDSVSAHQFEGVGIWDRKQNLYGWTSLLGERRGTDQVSIYASPARATDLTELPPAYFEVGSAETFRDEVVQYATKLWKDGVQCELHVWSGAFHGSDSFCPDAIVSVTGAKARMDWLERLLRGS